MCNFNDWNYENDNKIINKNIWNLIKKLEKNFNDLLIDKSKILNISPKVWEDYINKLSGKYK